MKPVQKVSIGGYAFTLEEDACKLAGDYLHALETHYAGREGGREIMEGIEERMAELLLEKNGSGGVVGEDSIRQIIGILGRPEAIEEESELDDSPSSPDAGSGISRPDGDETAHEAPKLRRKLYRDLEHKLLGGVCSGLGIYTNVDPIVYRLVFVVFSLFDFFHFFRGIIRGYAPSLHINLVFPLIYLILWILIPAAKTVRRRWEMRGETGSVDDIERKVGNDVHEISAVVGNIGRRTRSVLREAGSSPIGHAIGHVLRVAVGILQLLVGVAILAAGLGCYQGIFPSGMTCNYFWSRLSEEWPVVADFLSKPLSVILLVSVAVLPAIGMIYGGVMMLFKLKAPNWRPGLVIFVLWLIALVVLGVLIAMAAVSGTYAWT